MPYIVVTEYYTTNGKVSETREFLKASQAIEYYKDKVDEVNAGDAYNGDVSLFKDDKLVAHYLDLIGEFIRWSDRNYA